MADSSLDDFLKLDVRVGTIIMAQPFPEAHNPAYKLQINFGDDLGVRQSSAQVTVNYTCETLVGQQVLAIVNFSPRQIGPFMSEVLTLGVPDDQGEVILVKPSSKVPDGTKLY